MGLAHQACATKEGASFPLSYSAGPGPMALEPGALQQVEHRHGGLTDMHASRVNVPCRLRALERYVSENGRGGLNRTW